MPTLAPEGLNDPLVQGTFPLKTRPFAHHLRSAAHVEHSMINLLLMAPTFAYKYHPHVEYAWSLSHAYTQVPSTAGQEYWLTHIRLAHSTPNWQARFGMCLRCIGQAALQGSGAARKKRRTGTSTKKRQKCALPVWTQVCTLQHCVQGGSHSYAMVGKSGCTYMFVTFSTIPMHVVVQTCKTRACA